MSEPLRLGLVGATGLVGRSLIGELVGREDFTLTALARREMPLPRGARMVMQLAPSEGWGQAIGAMRVDCMVCALGTTQAKAGGDEAAFRAVDHDLVLSTAKAAYAAGTRHFIAISSVGAALSAKSFYLRVKGEVERDLAKIGFERLDILRPGLLRGRRNDDPRTLERIGQVLAPVMNLFLQGNWRRFRAIPAEDVARAILSLAGERARGRFTHEHDSLMSAAKRFGS